MRCLPKMAGLSSCQPAFRGQWSGPLRGVAQPGRAPALGAGCRQFESGRPDHLTFRVVPTLPVSPHGEPRPTPGQGRSDENLAGGLPFERGRLVRRSFSEGVCLPDLRSVGEEGGGDWRAGKGEGSWLKCVGSSGMKHVCRKGCILPNVVFESAGAWNEVLKSMVAVGEAL